MSDANRTTEFLGYPMDQVTYNIIVDMLVASFVILIIVLPSMCFKVNGATLKPTDEWDEIIARHQKEHKYET